MMFYASEILEDDCEKEKRRSVGGVMCLGRSAANEILDSSGT